MQTSPIRAAIIIIVAVLGILFTVPSFLPKDVLTAWPGFLPKQTHRPRPRSAGRLAPAAPGQPRRHHRASGSRSSAATPARSSPTRTASATSSPPTPTRITIELTDPTQKDAANTALQTLQNTISNSLFAGRRHPGARLRRDRRRQDHHHADPRGRHRAHVLARRAVDRSHPQPYRRARHHRADHPAPGHRPRPRPGPGLRGFDPPQGHHLAHRAPDLPPRPPDDDRRDRPRPRASPPATSSCRATTAATS